MLVLAATYMSHLRDVLNDLLPKERLVSLLERTIRFLRKLAPISNTLATDASILQGVLNKIEKPLYTGATSFSSNH